MGRTGKGPRRRAVGLLAIAVLVAGPVAVPAPGPAYADGGGTVVTADASDVYWVANALANNQGEDLVRLVFYEKTLQQMYLNDPTLSPTQAVQQIQALQKAVDAMPGGLLGLGQAGDAAVPGVLSLVQKVLGSDALVGMTVLEAAKTVYQYFSNKTTVANPDGTQQLTASTDLSVMANAVYGDSWSVLSDTIHQANDDGMQYFRTAQNMLFAAQTAPTSASAETMIDNNPTLLMLKQINGLVQSNGEIKAQLKDLRNFAAASFGQVLAQQQEAQDTLNHLAAVQVNILAYVQDIDRRQQEQAEAAAKAQAEQQVIGAANAGLYILASLIGLGDPHGAQVVSAVGNAVIQVAYSVSKFAELAASMGGFGNAIGSVAGAALTGNIVGAVFSLLPIFTGAKDPDQQILEAIGQLQQQVAELGKEMDVRFDHIDRSLNAIYDSMMSAFVRLDWRTGQILGGVTDTQNQLVQVHNQLTDLEGGLWSSLSDGFRRPFWNAVDSSLGYRKRTHHDLQPDAYVDASSQFYVWATTHAFDEASTGPAKRDYAPTRVAAELGAYPLDVNANYLATLPTSWGLPALSSRQLPNPHDWMLGARAYIALALDYPALAQQNHALRSEIRSLATGGADLQQFERQIQGGAPTAYGTATLNPLFATILQRYDGAVSDLGKAIAGKEQDFDANQARLDPFGGVDQTLPQAAGIGVLGCRVDFETGLPVPEPAFPITPATAHRIAPGAVRIMHYIGGATGHGRLTICRSGIWDDYQDSRVGNREITTAELTATVTSSFNGHPLLTQQAGLRRYTLCSVSATDPDPPACPDPPNPVTMVQGQWIQGAEPALDGTSAVTVLDQAALDQIGANAAAYLVKEQRAELAMVGDAFTTDAATRDAADRMTGLVAALRSYVQLGMPTALASDELLSAMLLGDTRLLDEDAQKRLSSWYYQQAVAQPAPGVEPWQAILGAVHASEGALASALGADLAAERAAHVEDGSLATATTMQRLSVLAATVLTPGAQFQPAVRLLKVPTTRVGSRRTVKVKLTNPGLGVLRVRKAAVKGSGVKGAGFSLAHNGCRKVAGHGTCTLLLRFAPHHRGKVKARLKLRTNTDRRVIHLRLSARVR